MKMKLREFRKLKEMTVDELAERYRHFKDELFNLRFQLATGRLEKNHRIKELKRDIARVMTLLEQKRRAARATQAARETKAPAKPGR
jgi:large subunit ribosomal protein L29